ncbi:hypothetical protein ABIA33_004843 [Streptacidiphilus sp. MAP12-16]
MHRRAAVTTVWMCSAAVTLDPALSGTVIR